MSTDREQRLEWVYAADGDDDVRRRYDVWAENYDSDVGSLQWTAPQAAAERCHRLVDPAKEILDAGCGTGLVGVALRDLGHTRIVGFDLSAAMLEHSAGRGAYAELHQGSLNERLPFDDRRFGAAIAVGVFTRGHAAASAFAELARVTEHGGHVIVTIRDDNVARLGYDVEQQRLVDSGVWTLVERTEPAPLIFEDGEVPMCVWTWKVA